MKISPLLCLQSGLLRALNICTVTIMQWYRWGLSWHWYWCHGDDEEEHHNDGVNDSIDISIYHICWTNTKDDVDDDDRDDDDDNATGEDDDGAGFHLIGAAQGKLCYSSGKTTGT